MLRHTPYDIPLHTPIITYLMISPSHISLRTPSLSHLPLASPPLLFSSSRGTKEKKTRGVRGTSSPPPSTSSPTDPWHSRLSASRRCWQPLATGDIDSMGVGVGGMYRRQGTGRSSTINHQPSCHETRGGAYSYLSTYPPIYLPTYLPTSSVLRVKRSYDLFVV